MASYLRGLAALVFLSLTAVGFASGAKASVAYTCALSSSQERDWIPSVLFIGHDAEAGRVVISDPIVLHFNNRLPLEGRVSANDAKRITFAWDYVAQDARGRRAEMQFHATWNKATQRMKVTAKRAGRRNGFSGTGRCERAEL